MPIYRQTHVKTFIENNDLSPDSFNAHSDSGAHTAYVVAAARKKGLTVVKIGTGHYFYDGDTLVGGIRSMVPSLVSSVAVSVCSNKTITKSLLESSQIPVPPGQAFKLDEFQKASQFFATFADPVVVKPVDGSAGDGITCGVKTQQNFSEAWDKAKDTTTRNGSILVEEYVTGLDIRAFVIGERMIAASTRLPAFVLGDGDSTIAELLEAKQAARNRNAYLGRMPIIVDHEWLSNSGNSLDSVPPESDVVLLNSTANLHQGGENVDITNQICPELRDLAKRAAAAIPGLHVSGIDLLVKSPQSAEGAVVLEANTAANISVHHLPAYGNAVDVGSAIVDEILRYAAIRAALAL